MQLYDFFYNYIFRVFTLILSIHLSIEHYLNIVSSYTEKAKTPKSKLKWIGLGLVIVFLFGNPTKLKPVSSQNTN